MKVSVSRRWHGAAHVVTLAATLAWPAANAHASAAFPALVRPALHVNAPARQVMEAAAYAGKRIVAVGERGLVVLSDDGGNSWRQAQSVPVSTTLTAVTFVNERLGWAVGHGGVILNTRDGGLTWTKQADGIVLAKAALEAAQAQAQSAPGSADAAAALKAAELLVADGPDKPLLDVRFNGETHGWVVGAYNLFFETRDGGRSWQSASARLNNPKALHLYVIRSRGAFVFIAGEQGQMFRSDDGGMTFRTLNSPYKGSWFTAELLDDQTVLVGGLRGNLYRSPDRGATWSQIEGLPPASFVTSYPDGHGGVLLGNKAGQLVRLAPGAAPAALPLPGRLPPLSSVLPLTDSSLLYLGLGGLIHLNASALQQEVRK